MAPHGSPGFPAPGWGAPASLCAGALGMGRRASASRGALFRLAAGPAHSSGSEGSTPGISGLSLCTLRSGCEFLVCAHAWALGAVLEGPLMSTPHPDFGLGPGRAPGSSEGRAVRRLPALGSEQHGCRCSSVQDADLKEGELNTERCAAEASLWLASSTEQRGEIGAFPLRALAPGHTDRS